MEQSHYICINMQYVYTYINILHVNCVFVKIQLTLCHVNICDYSSHTNCISLMRVIQLKVKCTSVLIYLICHFPFSSDTCDSVSIPAVNLLDNCHGFTLKVAFSTQVTYMTLQRLRYLTGKQSLKTLS